MLLIPQITSDSAQVATIILPDGSFLLFQIQFVPLQYSWNILSLTYQNFVLNGFRIVTSPNMLHQYRNQIPFGLACVTTDNRDPSLQQDFSSGNANLYILTSAEVLQFTEYLSGNT